MVTFLVQTLNISIIFLLGCIGEIFTEKAGHLNLGTPGIMCIGAAGGCLGVKIFMSFSIESFAVNYILVILLAVVFSAIFSAVASFIYSYLTVSLRANQNVTGLALTIFGAGFTTFFMNNAVKLNDNVVKASFTEISRTYFTAKLPFADNLGWFGQIFLSQGILFYLAIVLAVCAGLLLSHTRVGLNLRAVGEMPACADAVGINVTKYKYGFITLGSIISGWGGMFYVMDNMNGAWQNTDNLELFGWLAIALVIFTLWRPILSILGSILFGGLYIVPQFISLQLADQQLSTAMAQLFQIIPYIVTILVLIITSIRGKKENQGPACLGLPYFREDR